MNAIYENINTRYDRRQLAAQRALHQYEQDRELCMMFERVNANHARKHQPAKKVQRDFSSGIGLLLGLGAMVLFLAMGILLGF